jgi:hypothetical protein
MFHMMDTLGVGRTDDPTNFMVRSGRTDPDFFGGLNMLFRYKAFSLRTQFSVAFGAQKRLPAFYSSAGIPTPDRNLPRHLQNRWKNPGDELIPGIAPGVPGSRAETELTLPLLERNHIVNIYDMYNASDALVANADFIRCRGISLGYDIPEKYSKLVHIRRATVSFSLSNPFVIAFDKDWDGYDPETAGWPARRTMSFSINMSL